MSNCSKCGAEHATLARYCSACGALLEGERSRHKAEDPAVEKIVEIATREGLIAAIKQYRLEHNCDLRTAKDRVERILSEQGVNLPKGAGCAGILAAVGLILSYVLQAWMRTLSA